MYEFLTLCFIAYLALDFILGALATCRAAPVSE